MLFMCVVSNHYLLFTSLIHINSLCALGVGPTPFIYYNDAPQPFRSPIALSRAEESPTHAG